MSRLAKKPIIIPAGVDIQIDGLSVRVKGSKGELSRTFPRGIEFIKQDLNLHIKSAGRIQDVSRFMGLAYALITNMIQGVTKGVEKTLDLNGIGYKAAVKGKDLELNLGFSHPISVLAPQGIDFKVEKNRITISGIDKEVVGQVAAQIRKYRKPEPYKGKGIFYAGETITRKAGKKAATS